MLVSFRFFKKLPAPPFRLENKLGCLRSGGFCGGAGILWIGGAGLWGT